MRILFAILAAFVVGSAYAVAHQPTTAIVGATVVNPGQAPLENAVVVLRGERILGVGPADRMRIPRRATRVDATGKWIIPGLIDGHVHFFQSGGLYTRPDIYADPVRPYAEEHAAIREGLDDTFARYLRSGITSVADVGGPMWNFEVRTESYGNWRAPRVAVAGPLISSYEPPAYAHLDDRPIIGVTEPEAARQLVREQAARRPEFIKVWYIVTPQQPVERFLPVFEAVVDESRQHGLRVAVHATELETARAAVEAGADILVHGVFDRPVDDAFVALLKERDVLYVPTLAVMGGYARTFSQRHAFLPEEFALADPYVMGTLFDLIRTPERVRETDVPSPSVAQANTKRLHDAGVTVVAGTDAGNIGTLPGPSIFREFQLMADAGFTPAEILATATVNGARLLGLARDLGTVAAGKYADLVVLNADPLADIRNTADIHLVVRDGLVFTPDELVPFRAEDLVQRQLNAYNARDLDAFMATYADDVEVFYQGEFAYRGADEMRERYRRLFDDAPTLHARILDRRVEGNTVTDRERVTGIPGREVVEATATYEIEDRSIRRVRFRFGP